MAKKPSVGKTESPQVHLADTVTSTTSGTTSEEASQLHTPKEQIEHIERMSWRFLYIFSFLWGGLLYLYITQPENKVFVTIIKNSASVVTNVTTQDNSLRLMLLMPIYLIIFAMFVVLIILIANMLERKIVMKKSDELAFIQDKQKKLTYAVILGCLSSIFVILSIILILTSPPESLSNTLVATLKVAVQVLTFVYLIVWPAVKYRSSLPSISAYVNRMRNDWGTYRTCIQSSLFRKNWRQRTWIRTKSVFYWLRLACLLIVHHLRKSALLLMGLYIYVVYLLAVFFGLQIGIWIFMIFLILFLIYSLWFVAEYTIMPAIKLNYW